MDRAIENGERVAFCEDHPIDSIEPIKIDSSYREISQNFLWIFDRALTFGLNANSAHVALWQIAFALGSLHCEGKTMGQIASNLGMTRANFSKGARSFCAQTGIPPSDYMKEEEAAQSYKRSRESQLTKE